MAACTCWPASSARRHSRRRCSSRPTDTLPESNSTHTHTRKRRCPIVNPCSLWFEHSCMHTFPQSSYFLVGYIRAIMTAHMKTTNHKSQLHVHHGSNIVARIHFCKVRTFSCGYTRAIMTEHMKTTIHSSHIHVQNGSNIVARILFGKFVLFHVDTFMQSSRRT